MEKKLTQKIYDLILESNALKGRLQEANDRKEITITRWAMNENIILTTAQNLDVIFNYCKEYGIEDITEKEDLFAKEQAA